MKKFTTIFLAVVVLFALNAQSQVVEPLRLIQTISIPGLHDGDFDHFAADMKDHLLFLAAEENSAVEVFDLGTNKLIHTISDLKAPHSLVYRADLKKLFVVDGDAAEVKVYQGDSYKPVGSIKLLEDADSSTFDPATKYMYVVNGDKGAHMAYTLISVIDTTATKKLGDIKIDSDSVEAMALERSGPRMFANLNSKNAVAVIDRVKRTVMTTWSIADEGKRNAAIAFDEADHRLFVVARAPGKVIVLDSDSGKILNSLPCAGDSDDALYDAVGVLFDDAERHAQALQVLRQHLRGKSGLLLIEIDGEEIEAHRGAAFERHENVQQRVGVLASRHAHHHAVAVGDHAVVGNRLADRAAQLCLQFVEGAAHGTSRYFASR